MIKTKSLSIIFLLIITQNSSVWAEKYRPPVARFNGTENISLPGHVSLELVESGTLEFFVAAKWKGKAQHDPVLFSALTPKGPRYAIAITGDKQAIGLARDEDWDMAEFDFSDGKMHHVAFVVMNGVTDVYIDGKHEDTLLTGFGETEVTSFHLGSLNGKIAPFKGALAGLRIWDTPLDPDDLNRFKYVHIFSRRGMKHPDFDALVAVGDFLDQVPTLTLLHTDADSLLPEDPGAPTGDDAPVEILENVDLKAAAEYDAENQTADEPLDLMEIYNKALVETDD